MKRCYPLPPLTGARRNIRTTPYTLLSWPWLALGVTVARPFSSSSPLIAFSSTVLFLLWLPGGTADLTALTYRGFRSPAVFSISRWVLFKLAALRGVRRVQGPDVIWNKWETWVFTDKMNLFWVLEFILIVWSNKLFLFSTSLFKAIVYFHKF